MVELHADTQK